MFLKGDTVIMNYGYIRGISNCSPERDICIQKQLEKLENHEIYRIYKDEISDSRNDKKAFSQLIKDLNTGDTVIICQLSRIADNFVEFSYVFNEFKSNCIELNVLELGIITHDNINITGQSWLNALSNFEKDLKYEKRCIGFLKSKINKKTNNVIVTGRPEKYSKKQLENRI